MVVSLVIVFKYPAFPEGSCDDMITAIVDAEVKDCGKLIVTFVVPEVSC